MGIFIYTIIGTILWLYFIDKSNKKENNKNRIDKLEKEKGYVALDRDYNAFSKDIDVKRLSPRAIRVIPHKKAYEYQLNSNVINSNEINDRQKISEKRNIAQKNKTLDLKYQSPRQVKFLDTINFDGTFEDEDIINILGAFEGEFEDENFRGQIKELRKITEQCFSNLTEEDRKDIEVRRNFNYYFPSLFKMLYRSSKVKV